MSYREYQFTCIEDNGLKEEEKNIVIDGKELEKAINIFLLENEFEIIGDYDFENALDDDFKHNNLKVKRGDIKAVYEIENTAIYPGI